MGPILDHRSEADFKQAALQKFYNYLNNRMPGKWSRQRTGELLDIFERKKFRHRWQEGLKPFLQYRYASDLMALKGANYEIYRKAVNLFKEALNHPACPEFLKPKIMFQQAESLRLGRGHMSSNLCMAAQLYGRVDTFPASTPVLKKHAHTMLHSLLYHAAEPEIERLNQVHRTEKSAWQADLMTSRQATHVFQMRSAQLQQEKDRAIATACSLQKQNDELRTLLEQETKKREEVELHLRAHRDEQAENQLLHDLIRGTIPATNAVLLPSGHDQACPRTMLAAEVLVSIQTFNQ